MKKNARKHPEFLFFPLLLLILLIWPARQVNAGEVVLLYANDVHGETKPCG